MNVFQSWRKNIKKESNVIRGHFFLLPLFLCGIVIGFFAWDVFLHYRVDTETLEPNLFSTYRVAMYPQLASRSFPVVSAQAAFVLDADSHVVLYAKNPDVRFSPASTTKIMTALVGLDSFDLEQILTAWNVMDTQGSGLGLTVGEQLRFGDLLYGALLPSANDAAYTIAENDPGGMNAFLLKMNRKALALHLYNTHYSDPAGLNDDGDYTTARELSELASVAMDDPIFSHIVGIKTATIMSVDGKFTYPLESRNKLLGVDGINGIKTGYTDEAGEVLATSVKKDGHQFYIVVMRSKDRFADTLLLLHFIEENLSYLSIRP